jgi:hypothetical protein
MTTIATKGQGVVPLIIQQILARLLKIKSVEGSRTNGGQVSF